jgi:hypothetical protein
MIYLAFIKPLIMKKLFVLIVTTLIMVQLFSQKTTIYPTYPGTSVRDYSKPAIVIEKNKIYNTYPGTSVRDYSKPSYTGGTWHTNNHCLS